MTEEPAPLGPLASRSLARRAAQALAGHTATIPAAALEPLRGRVRRLAGDQRFEDAARARDRIAALEQVVGGPAGARPAPGAPRLRRRARAATGLRPGARARRRARVAAIRLLPRGPGVRVGGGGARRGGRARRTAPAGPEDVDELRLVASFLRKPPPELRVVALERDAICALVDGIPLAA